MRGLVLIGVVMTVLLSINTTNGENILKYAGSSSSFFSSYVLPVISSSGACAASTTGTQSPYEQYEVQFPTSGVREVAAMAEKSFKSTIRIYIYATKFDPKAPCTNLLRGTYLDKRFSSQGGPVIDDFINFDSTIKYQFIVTGTSTTGGLFAMNIFPSNATGSLANSTNYWLPPTQSSSSDCDTDYTNTPTPAAIYTWTQPLTGYFDIIATFDNTSAPSFSSYLAIFAGSNPNISDPCNVLNVSSTNLIVTNSQSDFGVFASYVSLTAGSNYTAVFSGRDGQSAYWGIQVIPTRLRFLKATPGFTQPQHLSSSVSLCKASTSTSASWDATIFTAEHDTYLIDTGSPPYPFSTTDTYSFLYSGSNRGSPPSTCPLTGALVYDGDTGDVTPVFAYTAPGHNYTVVVSTYSGGAANDNAPYVLYLFTGDATGGTGAAVTVVVAPVVVLFSVLLAVMM